MADLDPRSRDSDELIAAGAADGEPGAYTLAELADRPLLPVRHRGLLLAAVMLVSIRQFLDATIAMSPCPKCRLRSVPHRIRSVGC